MTEREPPGVESPFDRHDYDPADLYGHVFFAFKETGEGPQLVWDPQTEHIHPSMRLELAEHLDAFAGNLRRSYWQYVGDRTNEAPEGALDPVEDRTYE